LSSPLSSSCQRGFYCALATLNATAGVCREPFSVPMGSTTDLAAGFTGTVTPLKSSPQPGGLPAGYEQYEALFPSGTVRGFLKVEATVQP
jgi:hypothetical protein